MERGGAAIGLSHDVDRPYKWGLLRAFTHDYASLEAQFRYLHGYTLFLNGRPVTEADLQSVTLFPLVETQFTEPELHQMEERFEELENNVIGVGRHAEYHGWIAELSKIYGC